MGICLLNTIIDSTYHQTITYNLCNSSSNHIPLNTCSCFGSLNVLHRQIDNFLYWKVYNSTAGDVVPMAIANVLNLRMNIPYNNSSPVYLLTSIKPRTPVNDNSNGYVILHLRNDHYSCVNIVYNNMLLSSAESRPRQQQLPLCLPGCDTGLLSHHLRLLVLLWLSNWQHPHCQHLFIRRW